MSNAKQKPSINHEILRVYLRATLQNRRYALLSLLSPVGAVLTNVGVPFYAGKALASTLHNDGHFQSHMLHLVVLAILGILANRFGFISNMVLQAKTMHHLNALVFQRLLRRGSSFHSNRISGKLVSDALDFVAAYSTLMNAIFNSGLALLSVLLIGLVVIGVNSWQLGLFLLFCVSFTLAWTYRDSLRRHELRGIRLVATRNLTGHLADSIVNAQTVKTFAGEDREINENERLNVILRNLRIKDWSWSGANGNNRSAVLLVMLILLLLLIHRVAGTDPTILSTGIFAFTYTFTLLLRLFDLNTLTRQVEESFLQASPITKNLLEPDEILDAADAKKLQVSRGDITLSKVGFNYVDRNDVQAVFKNFNLTIAPGEKIGVVGPSGGGKSTLTKLLLRFEDIQIGSICIDDQNIAQVTQQSLRQAIAYVPQEPLLFHRTIRDNIGYGKPGATEAEILTVAKKAFAHDFIEKLPQGYDTLVGERGVKLSGGQRQRVAIARAMLKDAPILILDEATSALDSESEKVIQQALWELMDGKTAIVIAHRLSTIQRLDRIIVLDDGKIVENGTHAELLKQNGLYARLWSHQSGGFIEE